MSGRSAETIARKVGLASPPAREGPARNVPVDCAAKFTAKVPLVVTGDPVTLKNESLLDRPTLVTLPPPRPEIRFDRLIFLTAPDAALGDQQLVGVDGSGGLLGRATNVEFQSLRGDVQTAADTKFLDRAAE